MRSGFKSVFNLLCFEGAFAMAYETWIGPTYLSGLAGELGVGVGWVALLTAAPWIGQVGQVLGTRWGERAPSVKAYTLRLAWSARLLWLAPLALAMLFGAMSAYGARPFPVEAWFGFTTAIACVSSWIACSSAVAWNSWMKGMIPAGLQSRFFGIRQRATMGAVILANGLAAVLVGIDPQGYRVGYFAIGIVAVISGVLSTVLLSKVPPPPADGVERASEPLRRLREIYKEPLRDRRFLRFLGAAAAFHFALLMAGPYFPYFFTRDLEIPMSTVSVWIMLASASACVTAPYWGRKLDRSRDPRRVLRFCGFLMAISPLPYLVTSVDFIRAMAPVDHLINGAVSSGYLLATLAILFRVSPKKGNWAYFSFYSAAIGLSGACGALLGGWLAEVLTGWAGGFRGLWVIAVIGRSIAVLIVFPSLLPEFPAADAKPQSRD